MASLHLHGPLLSSPPANCLTLKYKSSPSRISFSLNSSNSEIPSTSSHNSSDAAPETGIGNVNRIKLAFEKARNYKKLSPEGRTVEADVSSGTEISRDEDKEKQVASSVKAAFEKAKEYRKNKEAIKDGTQNVAVDDAKLDDFPITDIDFSENKIEDDIPADLMQIIESFREAKEPEVEILIGDTSKFGDNTPSVSESEENDAFDLYKPKVSTWGVFPRPENISKTFGGGRNIRPGDALETEEERAAKDKRTRAMLAAYKKKIGLLVDPKLNSECEEILKNGEALMDTGKLADAIYCYEQVMEKLPFQSELHGIAALQWSICKDSMSRGEEARGVYEKLQNHPNGQVRKRAKHFVYSFQAMQMMKVGGANLMEDNSDYQKYFDAFVADKTVYTQPVAKVESNGFGETLPYLLLLFLPVFSVLFLSILKMK